MTGTRNQFSWRTTTETINGQTTQNPTSSGSSSSYDTQQLIAGFYPGNYHGKQVEWPESGLPPSPFEDNEDSAPRNYDMDGDGALDAFELLSMRWDQTKQVVTTLVQSKMEQMLTDVKSGNGINLAAEATSINARISSAKKGLESAAKALETLRNDGLSGLTMQAGAALGNMIGVGQFASAWEGRLEDGTRLHGSARWLDGVLGVVNIGLTVYPGTSAIKNGITAAMAAKTMLNGMGKTTWKKFASATATAYCKITVGECFVGDTIEITGTRPQALIATADSRGIDGWEWIVSATGLVLVSRLARDRSKKDDELTHTERPRLEWSPLDPDDSSEGFVSGLSFPRKRESNMHGDVEVDNLIHSQQKSRSKVFNANAGSTVSCDGFQQWAPLVCAANATIRFNEYPLDPSRFPCQGGWHHPALSIRLFVRNEAGLAPSRQSYRQLLRSRWQCCLVT